MDPIASSRGTHPSLDISRRVFTMALRRPSEAFPFGRAGGSTPEGLMSSSPVDGHPFGTRPKRSLSEELASLRIEREEPPRREAAPHANAYRPARARRGRGRGILGSVI